jgi:hypothetical protein
VETAIQMEQVTRVPLEVDLHLMHKQLQHKLEQVHLLIHKVIPIVIPKQLETNQPQRVIQMDKVPLLQLAIQEMLPPQLMAMFKH